MPGLSCQVQPFHATINRMHHPVHHIGIVVENLPKARAEYERLWNAEITPTELLHDRGLELCFVKCGNTLIELLAPVREDSTISKFLKDRGPGLHHICYEVPNLKAELARLAAAGVELIDKTPRPGAEGTMIAFLHPRSGLGTLVELLERTE